MQQIIPNSSVDIKVHDSFLPELQDLIIYYTSLIPEEEIMDQIQKIEKSEELSEWGKGYSTLLKLLNEIETSFIEQGLVKEKD